MASSVIFLDFDGVLRPAKMDPDEPGFDPGAIRALQKIAEDAGAGIVLTTTRRLKLPLETHQRDLAEAGLAAPVVGATPNLRGAPRAQEILAYLAEHPEVKSWVVLDDDLQADPGDGSFVPVEPFDGLSAKHAEAALGILSRAPRHPFASMRNPGERCFACGRPLGKQPYLADTRDGQAAYVGAECAKKIKAAGEKGWQPPKGGPRLYLLRSAGLNPQRTKEEAAILRVAGATDDPRMARFILRDGTLVGGAGRDSHPGIIEAALPRWKPKGKGQGLVGLLRKTGAVRVFVSSPEEATFLEFASPPTKEQRDALYAFPAPYTVERSKNITGGVTHQTVGKFMAMQDLEEWFAVYENPRGKERGPAKIVAWHGSNRRFDRFVPTPGAEEGFYFSPTPETARFYGSILYKAELFPRRVYAMPARDWQEGRPPTLEELRSAGYDAVCVRPDPAHEDPLFHPGFWVMLDPARIRILSVSEVSPAARESARKRFDFPNPEDADLRGGTEDAYSQDVFRFIQHRFGTDALRPAPEGRELFAGPAEIAPGLEMSLWVFPDYPLVRYWAVTAGSALVGAGEVATGRVPSQKTWQTASAYFGPELRGKNLYPKVLQNLRAMLGTPLQSSTILSASARSAWRKMKPRLVETSTLRPARAAKSPNTTYLLPNPAGNARPPEPFLLYRSRDFLLPAGLFPAGEPAATAVSLSPGGVYFGFTPMSFAEAARMLPAERGQRIAANPEGRLFHLPAGLPSGYPSARGVIDRLRAQPLSPALAYFGLFFGLATANTPTHIAEARTYALRDFLLSGRLPTKEEAIAALSSPHDIGWGKASFAESLASPSFGDYPRVLSFYYASGLRDRALRRALYLDAGPPAGLGLIKLSFALELLGQNVACLDRHLLNYLVGTRRMKDEMATISPGRASSRAVREKALARYEALEGALIRGNPFYDPSDPLALARCQWMTWEAIRREKATHKGLYLILAARILQTAPDEAAIEEHLQSLRSGKAPALVPKSQGFLFPEMVANPPSDRRIKISYEIITPESAEEGDVDERGWEDEEGVSMEPEDKDESAVRKAAEFLRHEGVTEASSSFWHPGGWYLARETDHYDGSETTRSFHLSGFSPTEEKGVYMALFGHRIPGAPNPEARR